MAQEKGVSRRDFFKGAGVAAAGAAMARASDAEAASPTAKRRVVEALTASPAVVVPRKVTVAG